MTRLYCDACETFFEQAEEGSARCPQCLRGARLAPEPVVQQERGRAPRKRLFVLLLLICGGIFSLVELEDHHGTSLESRDGLLQEAKTALAQGDRKGAYRAAKRATDLAPKSSEAREVLGDIFLASRAQREALVEFQAALAMGERAILHVKVGNLAKALGERELSLDHLRKALALEPDAPWADRVRAEIQGAGASKPQDEGEDEPDSATL